MRRFTMPTIAGPHRCDSPDCDRLVAAHRARCDSCPPPPLPETYVEARARLRAASTDDLDPDDRSPR